MDDHENSPLHETKLINSIHYERRKKRPKLSVFDLKIELRLLKDFFRLNWFMS